MSREIDHFFLWRQDQKFDEAVDEAYQKRDTYKYLYEGAAEKLATLHREMRDESMPDEIRVSLLNEVKAMRKQLSIRVELLADFLEYCENVGLIKNADNRKIIDDYKSSKNLP